MENYKVYLHTLPNGKRYVGITKQEPEKRWLNGKGYIQQDFRADIDFYGWENILHEIIADNLTEEQACEMEIFYIKKYDTLNEEKGYNKLLGRQGGYCKLGKSKQTFWQRIFGDVMFEKVQKYAKDRKFTISTLVRLAVEQYIKTDR